MFFVGEDIRKLRDMKYKIVEKDNHNAVHSLGYYSKEKAQQRIDSGECKKYWMDKEAEFEVIEDTSLPVKM